MWTEVDLGLSPDAERALFGEAGRSPRTFRKMLAAMSTAHAMDLGNDFFGYGPDGQTKDKGDTTTGIGCNKGGLHLMALGREAGQHLMAKAPLIHSALITQAQQLIPMHVRTGEHSATFLPYEKRFVIRNLCVGRSKPDTFWLRASKAVQEGSTWLQEADRMLPKYIGRGLMRQAFMLLDGGDEVEGNVTSLLAPAMQGERHWREVGQEFGERLGLKLHAVGGHTYIKIAEARTALVLKDVEFTARIDLGGPWFAGRLKIEARGQLLPASRDWAMPPSGERA